MGLVPPPQDCWSDGCCSSAHPIHPAAGCQIFVVPTPGPQAASPQHLPSPKAKTQSELVPSRHPNDQGRLPAWPLRNYTDLSVSPPLLLPLQGLTLGVSEWSSHVPLDTSLSPTAKKSHFKTGCRAGRVWPNRCSGCLACRVWDLIPYIPTKKTRVWAHACNASTWLRGVRRI